MIIDDNNNNEETMKEMFEIVQFLESQEEYRITPKPAPHTKPAPLSYATEKVIVGHCR
jgi:hypothetical protein